MHSAGSSDPAVYNNGKLLYVHLSDPPRAGPATIVAFENKIPIFLERSLRRGVQPLMNYLFAVLALLFSSLSWCQSAGNRTDMSVDARKVRTTAAGSLSPQVQAGSWLEKVQAQPSNADGWLNYFLWNSRIKNASGQASSQTIITQAQEHIAGTPQFFLMQYLASAHRDSAALFRAFDRASDKGWLYPYMVQYSILSGNRRELLAYCKALDGINTINKILYEYNYNILMSADSNATVYARGLNDLVPMAVLQQVHGVRADIKLRYYDGVITDKSNAYLALSLGKDVLAQYPTASCTGLLVRLDAANGFEEMRRHMENDMKLDELAQVERLPADDGQLYRNYLPALVLMYRYYRPLDAVKAARTKALIEKIAGATGVPADKLPEE